MIEEMESESGHHKVIKTMLKEWPLWTNESNGYCEGTNGREDAFKTFLLIGDHEVKPFLSNLYSIAYAWIDLISDE